MLLKRPDPLRYFDNFGALFNPLNAYPTKWSDTQAVRICLTILWEWRLKG